MTDEEIMRRLKHGAILLSIYKQTVKPAAEALARRKSLFVYGNEDSYSGDLGCWDKAVAKRLKNHH